MWWLDADEFRYIFNNGSKDGWRIGNEDGLKTGSYFYKSKSSILTLDLVQRRVFGRRRGKPKKVGFSLEIVVLNIFSCNV